MLSRGRARQRRYELVRLAERGAGRRSRRRQPGSLAAGCTPNGSPPATRWPCCWAAPTRRRPTWLRRADAAGAGAGARAVGSAGLAPGHPGGGNGGASRCRRCRDWPPRSSFPTEPDGLMGKGIQLARRAVERRLIWGMGASLTQPIFHGCQLLPSGARPSSCEASIEQYKGGAVRVPGRGRHAGAAGSRQSGAGRGRVSRRSAEWSYRNTASRVRLWRPMPAGQRTALHLGAIGRGAGATQAADGNGGAVPGHGFAGAGARPGTRQARPPPRRAALNQTPDTFLVSWPASPWRGLFFTMTPVPQFAGLRQFDTGSSIT